MKNIITILSVAALGASLAGCGSSGGAASGPAGPIVPPASGPTKYFQIERLSRPAVKEVFEPLVDHQVSNSVEPYADTTIQNDIVGTEDALRPPSSSAGTDFGKTLASVLYPDEYTVNLNGTSPSSSNKDPEFFLSEVADGATYFGGRAPNDDVIDLELPILFGHLLPALGVTAEDNEENDCISAQNVAATKVPTTNTFPYLPSPH